MRAQHGQLLLVTSHQGQTDLHIACAALCLKVDHESRLQTFIERLLFCLGNGLYRTLFLLWAILAEKKPGACSRQADRHQQRHSNHQDRKSTRLNSSHVRISYAVFCLKKKKKTK